MDEEVIEFYRVETTKLFGNMLENLQRIKNCLEEVNVSNVPEDYINSIYFFEATKRLSRGLESFLELAELARIAASGEKE